MLNVGKHLPKSSGFDLDRIIVSPDEKIKFPGDFDPDYHGEFKDKAATEIELQSNIQELAAQQDVLYANGTYALLIIFQALDAAGKDSTIKHVMTGVNPQGCQVYNFKAPSTEELNHDYLWRTTRCLPERGRIGIFNRSESSKGSRRRVGKSETRVVERKRVRPRTACRRTAFVSGFVPRASRFRPGEV